MPPPFRSDRDWTFDVGSDELWTRIASIEEYPLWWPWLRRFDPEGGFDIGARWRCEVAPPLPYKVRFVVVLDRIDEGSSATASVTGDVRGSATLTVSSLEDGGSSARLRSTLAPANPMLRGFGRMARPLVEWGHDWVLDQGRRQFIDRAF